MSEIERAIEKKEYIERGAALETLKEVVYSELEGDQDNGRANYIIRAIEMLPTASVDTVVLCEECMFNKAVTGEKPQCTWWRTIILKKHFYCANGKRKGVSRVEDKNNE